MVKSVKLHHFTSKQVVPSDKLDCILLFLESESKFYMKFREELITVPEFLQKNWKTLTGNKRDASKLSLKLLGKTQKNMDIACLRALPLCGILQYDLTKDCPLFDEVGLARHKNMKY